MSGERPTLAEVIDAADNRWQHGIGSSGHDPNGPPLWLADAARQWFLDLLADDTLTERAAVADFLGWTDHDEQGQWSDLPAILKTGPRDAARAVLAVIAEAVRDER